jgi:hypothetical protein
MPSTRCIDPHMRRTTVHERRSHGEDHQIVEVDTPTRRIWTAWSASLGAAEGSHSSGNAQSGSLCNSSARALHKQEWFFSAPGGSRRHVCERLCGIPAANAPKDRASAGHVRATAWGDGNSASPIAETFARHQISELVYGLTESPVAAWRPGSYEKLEARATAVETAGGGSHFISRWVAEAPY